MVVAKILAKLFPIFLKDKLIFQTKEALWDYGLSKEPNFSNDEWTELNERRLMIEIELCP